MFARNDFCLPSPSDIIRDAKTSATVHGDPNAHLPTSGEIIKDRGSVHAAEGKDREKKIRPATPATISWKLALVTVMQFAEDLSGSLARAAGRARNGGETVSDLNDVLAVRRIKTSTM